MRRRIRQQKQTQKTEPRAYVFITVETGLTLSWPTARTGCRLEVSLTSRRLRRSCIPPCQCCSDCRSEARTLDISCATFAVRLRTRNKHTFPSLGVHVMMHVFVVIHTLFHWANGLRAGHSNGHASGRCGGIPVRHIWFRNTSKVPTCYIPCQEFSAAMSYSIRRTLKQIWAK